jgi:general secretion pathway protein E
MSTLHTNTAVGAVTRLRDMGVEPFLLSSSLLAIVAQRLVRLLCPACKQPHTADAADCGLLGVPAGSAPRIYKPAGCPECNHLGYRGRTGIYELLVVDEAMRTLVHDRAAEQEMERLARQGFPGIREDGMRRVLAGETSLEEVLRVTREDGRAGAAGRGEPGAGV